MAGTDRPSRPGTRSGPHPFGLAAMVGLALAAGPIAAQDLFEETKEQCAGCHGVGDMVALEGAPALGGIDAYYALLQLVAFREGDRENEIMNSMVADMSDDDLRAASDWIAGLDRPTPPEEEPDAARMEAGAKLADANRCGSCHGAEYLGGSQMPPLRNQHEDYILKSLQDYKAERRIGARAAMVEIATPLSDDDMATLAYYFAHLPG
ncbi:cytochrome c553 [Palleronia aestuarii]|uniref:Cytochrome c553 n=1 Tax=Palleronia aestuarii TaxID=568105 RepID=A0A2W7N9X8_9RHOB|nr:c-type cytochrome [Palleronia aestuarii]PZX17041.1 cytochrome c553 [Palleronia aestuarii]